MGRSPVSIKKKASGLSLAKACCWRWENKNQFGSYNRTALPIFQNFSGGIVTAGAHHAAAGMSGRAAKVKSFDGRAIIGITRQWSHESETRKRHGTLHDIAASKAKHRFEVRRRQDLIVNDGFAEVGRV